jgi:hypothetical protein
MELINPHFPLTEAARPAVLEMLPLCILPGAGAARALAWALGLSAGPGRGQVLWPHRSLLLASSRVLVLAASTA